MVFGESDRLPGVVIDQFNECLVVQINTAGMEMLKTVLLRAIEQVLQPRVIVLKCDSSERQNEGLNSYTEVVKGEISENITVIENGCRYQIPILSGQKTGWFFDHRCSRQRIANYCKEKRVLDVFSYVGGFSIPCAKHGASEVIAIDRKATVLEILQSNAKLNECHKIKTIEGDALDVMQNLIQMGEKFDCVILDPPALIKRKKDIPAGSKLYQKLNEAALHLINRTGILFSASCSMHLSAADLLNCIRKAGLATHKELSLLEQCHQAPDHPVHPAIPETNYLKGFIIAVQD